MKRIFLLWVLLLILSPKITFATAQVPDVIIYNNKISDLFTLPLEELYKDDKNKPQFSVEPGGMRSNHWRGYTAIWEIIENKLFLRGLDSWICNSKSGAYKEPVCHRADLKELFGNNSKKGRVYANWFSGNLRIADGQPLDYDETSGWFSPVYEREIVIKVNAGKIVSQTTVENSIQKGN